VRGDLEVLKRVWLDEAILSGGYEFKIKNKNGQLICYNITKITMIEIIKILEWVSKCELECYYTTKER
jgi:hypothetical protein